MVWIKFWNSRCGCKTFTDRWIKKLKFKHETTFTKLTSIRGGKIQTHFTQHLRLKKENNENNSPEWKKCDDIVKASHYKSFLRKKFRRICRKTSTCVFGCLQFFPLECEAAKNWRNSSFPWRFRLSIFPSIISER